MQAFDRMDPHRQEEIQTRVLAATLRRFGELGDVVEPDLSTDHLGRNPQAQLLMQSFQAALHEELKLGEQTGRHPEGRSVR
eukprot:5775282-Amphidinium_carterae.1